MAEDVELVLVTKPVKVTGQSKTQLVTPEVNQAVPPSAQKYLWLLGILKLIWPKNQ